MNLTPASEKLVSRIVTYSNTISKIYSLLLVIWKFHGKKLANNFTVAESWFWFSETKFNRLVKAKLYDRISRKCCTLDFSSVGSKNVLAEVFGWVSDISKKSVTLCIVDSFSFNI